VFGHMTFFFMGKIIRIECLGLQVAFSFVRLRTSSKSFFNVKHSSLNSLDDLQSESQENH